MDGNGRWAQKRGLPRSAGHKAGAETFRKHRHLLQEPGHRLSDGLRLFDRKLEAPEGRGRRASCTYSSNICTSASTRWKRTAIRLRFLGDPQRADAGTSGNSSMRPNADLRAASSGFQANVCLNYGGRDEILHAARAFARDCAAGKRDADALTEEGFSALPLFMRTSRSRPSHPPGRGEAHQQLPFVAVRVQRVRTSATRSGPTLPRKNSTRRSSRISIASAASAV